MAPDTVLIQSGGVAVTRADYDVDLLRLPPSLRGGFATDERRVGDLLVRMLLTRQLAAEAESTGVMNDPVLKARLASEIERFKAQVMILQIESDAGKRFDSEPSRWDARARDLYLADTKRFETPEYRELQVLPFHMAKRGGREAALKQAGALRERWVAGEPWSKLAPESDIAGADSGDAPQRFARTDLPSAVADKVFALPDATISEPLVSDGEVFVFRVVGRIPSKKQTFDEARPRIMDELRKKFVDAERDRVLGAMSTAARAGINKEAMDKMVLKVDAARIEQLQREALERSRATKKPD